MKTNEINCNLEELDYITDSVSILGRDKALTICMEECSELIQSISKVIRNKEGSVDSVIEEVADVLICIEWIRDILDIDDDTLAEAKEYKIRRIQTRIKSNTFS